MRAGGAPAGCEQCCGLRSQRPRTAQSAQPAGTSAHPAPWPCCANRLLEGTQLARHIARPSQAVAID